MPPRIDETYEAPLPETRPQCGGFHVRETRLAVQYQTEVPRKVRYRQFNVHARTCRDCGRAVQGRHSLQTSLGHGAAASQLGPNLHAALALLNKQLGLSHGKSVNLLAMLFVSAHPFHS